MDSNDYFARLTPSSEILTPAEAQLIVPFFTNSDRSVVALKNLPEVIKGALFSRYSRSAQGVRRLFLDEFLPRRDLGIDDFSRGANHLHDQISAGEERAEDFYRRVLSDYGDDSVAELGGAHLACQDISQIAAKVIESGRIGISYLEKSSRYVPFDDKVNGQYRYYRPHRIMQSRFAGAYVAMLDALFDAYARHLPRMTEHVAQRNPIDQIEFENALTGDVVPFENIRDEDMLKSALFAYRQAVRARACDMLRCFLPLATLTNVGVWGNGRALEYMLVRLYAEELEEPQIIAQAAQAELGQVLGPFLKRANDERGKTQQAFLQSMIARQRELAQEFLTANPHPAPPPSATREGVRKVTLVSYDADAIERVVSAILFAGSELPKAEIVARVREMSDADKARIVRAYVGERHNRRHKPGRAFEHTAYEFDLLLNIGEYRDYSAIAC